MGPARIEPPDVFPLGGKEPALQLLDVRAPVEVLRSGIPGALSMPILEDDERHAVGQCYHDHGNEAAVALGVELTEPHREARVAGWREAVAASERPTAFVCWRGGQRSGIATEWLGDPEVSRVKGGTKALRQYLMTSLDSQFARTETLVISGLTGCGKTDFLKRLEKIVPPEILPLDLEGLANHRGSAFGGFPAGQPAQQTFENSLAAAVHLGAPRVTLVEDEAAATYRSHPRVARVHQANRRHLWLGPWLVLHLSSLALPRQLAHCYRVHHARDSAHGHSLRLRPHHRDLQLVQCH